MIKKGHQRTFFCSLLIGGSIIQPNSNIHMVSRRNHCYNMYEAQKVSLGHPGRCFSIDLRYFTFTTIFFLYCHSYAHVRRGIGSNYIKHYYILLPQPSQQQRRWNGSNYIKLYYILLSLLRISSDSFPEEGRNNIRNMVVDIFHKPTSNFQVDQNISIRRSFFIR